MVKQNKNLAGPVSMSLVNIDLAFHIQKARGEGGGGEFSRPGPSPRTLV